jgi:hypothetical protein
MTFFFPTHITGAASTQIKTFAGELHSIVINKADAHTITIYDGTSATTGTVIAVLPASAVVGTYIYDVTFSFGLLVVTAASYAGDVTICSR